MGDACIRCGESPSENYANELCEKCGELFEEMKKSAAKTQEERERQIYVSKRYEL